MTGVSEIPLREASVLESLEDSDFEEELEAWLEHDEGDLEGAWAEGPDDSDGPMTETEEFDASAPEAPLSFATDDDEDLEPDASSFEQ